MSLNELSDRTGVAEATILDVCVRHGVEPEDLDFLPHPRDGVNKVYLSYGPDDEDVELVDCDANA